MFLTTTALIWDLGPGIVILTYHGACVMCVAKNRTYYHSYKEETDLLTSSGTDIYQSPLEWGRILISNALGR
jgi:beta-glucosidase/6-phospho-beta-glucosidase/beta-galactosidase